MPQEGEPPGVVSFLGGTTPETTRAEIKGDARLALVLRPPATLSTPVAIPPEGELRFSLAVRPPEADVRIHVAFESGKERIALFDRNWILHRRWRDEQVELQQLAGRQGQLVWSVEGDAARVLVASPEIVTRASAEHLPNVILYNVDCLAAGHVGAYGYTRGTTPNIDRLAKDGIVFERTYSCAAWTKPSVGCLFTSQYPPEHGARMVLSALGHSGPTLAESFKEAGYATAAIVANPVLDGEAFGFWRGFDRYVQLAHQWRGSNVNDVPADAARITKAATDWLGVNQDRRFFLYLHSLDLHAKYRPRPPFDRQFVTTTPGSDIDLYDNELAYNDREIGRLIAELDRLDLYDDALIVLTSDHGEEFGLGGNYRHGTSLSEVVTHIPWIVKLPGSRARGARVEALASNIDQAPTLFALAGLRSPPAWRGRSLGPTVPVDPGEATLVFAEQLSPKASLWAVRGDRYKYVYRLTPEHRERLFDLAEDPAERNDILHSPPADAQSAISALKLFMASAQGGYHVRVRAPERRERVRLVAESSGAIEDVRQLTMRTGDKVEISDDGRRLVYEYDTMETLRHIVFRTEPRGEPVTLRIRWDGVAPRADQIALARNTTPLDPEQITASSEQVSLGSSQVGPWLDVTESPIAIWYLRAPSESVTPSADLANQLRALGYIQ